MEKEKGMSEENMKHEITESRLSYEEAVEMLREWERSRQNVKYELPENYSSSKEAMEVLRELELEFGPPGQDVKYELPKSHLSYEEAVEVLRELEHSWLNVELTPLCNSSFYVHIVGKLKFDEITGSFAIQGGGPTEDSINFQFSPDLAFHYLDWLWGHPYGGTNLTIFSADGF